jgi:hypothetical protein
MLGHLVRLLFIRWLLKTRRRWCAYRLWQDGCGITYCSSFEQYCEHVPEIPVEPPVLHRAQFRKYPVLIDAPYSKMPPRWVWSAIFPVAQEHYAWFAVEHDNTCRFPKTREDECRLLEYPLTW